MKKCKYCQSEIDDKAKICPHCQKRQKGMGGVILLGIIVVIIVIAIATSGGTTPTSSNNSGTKITKENYEKISNGMTKDEVFAIIGNDATTSESETPGVGKMELYHYQETLSTKAITITFLDEKVYSKNWTDL